MIGRGEKSLGTTVRVDKSFLDLMSSIKQRHKETFGVELSNPQITKSVVNMVHQNNFLKAGKFNKDDNGGIFR